MCTVSSSPAEAFCCPLWHIPSVKKAYLSWLQEVAIAELCEASVDMVFEAGLCDLDLQSHRLR